jgi:hypothetical protein
MMPDSSVLPLRGADGLLTLLQILAMSYFAFVTWRSGAGRLASVFLVAVLVEAVLSGMEVVMWVAGSYFSYTDGTEGLWMALWSGSMVVGVVGALALFVAGVAFLKLARRAKKSRRA